MVRVLGAFERISMSASHGIDSTLECLRGLLDTKDVQLEAIRSGRNNQGFRVVANGQLYFCKRYFQQDNVPRNERQDVELEFMLHVNNSVTGKTPKVVGFDQKAGVTVFEYILGESFKNPISPEDALDAVGFLAKLNEKSGEGGTSLRNASDSCFSLREHVDHVERRLKQLENVANKEGVPPALRSFLEKELQPCFEQNRAALDQFCMSLNYSSDKNLSLEARILSPSDFGFHNALKRADGAIVYLDFEYAGWDDPLKTLCDFMTQPDYPVPLELVEVLIERFPALSLRRNVSKLCRLLLPLYLCKWTCIILNPLSPCVRSRRAFSGLDEKAEAVLQSAQCYFRKHEIRAFEL